MFDRGQALKKRIERGVRIHDRAASTALRYPVYGKMYCARSENQQQHLVSVLNVSEAHHVYISRNAEPIMDITSILIQRLYRVESIKTQRHLTS
jgi:hypothetical protein